MLHNEIRFLKADGVLHTVVMPSYTLAVHVERQLAKNLCLILNPRVAHPGVFNAQVRMMISGATSALTPAA